MNSISILVDNFFKKDEFSKNDISLLGKVLQNFCKSGKKEDAFSVYFCYSEIFNIFGSKRESAEKLLKFLADHEYHSGELLDKHRDHYSHSVYVFALGLAIFANNAPLRNAFFNFYKEEGFNEKDFLKYWGLVALFHDVGYPFQLAHEQIKNYCVEMFGNNANVLPRVGYENMDFLLSFEEWISYDDKAFSNINDLLAYDVNKLLGYDFKVVKDTLDKRYSNKEGYMDHGYFSALLLAKQLMESKQQFSTFIVNSLSAILLHNSLIRHDFKDVFPFSNVELEKHPFAYLLMLCDELQNWDRTAFGLTSKKDPLAWGIDLNVSDDEINVKYIFDSVDVLYTTETTQHEIIQGYRENKNVSNLRYQDGEEQGEKKFIDNINKVIIPHVTIVADYIIASKEAQQKQFASSDKFVNIYSFAQAIHRSYQLEFGGVDFCDLPLEFKLSNIEQAKSYADKLELINCFYSDKEMDYPVVTGFEYNDNDGDRQTRRDLGFLCREEHIRWVKEKLDNDWKYGREGIDYTKENRNKRKLHKDIIPYDCLPIEEQRKDELMIQNMVKFLYHFGNGVRIYSFREGRKPILNIAGCGHRTIKKTDDLMKKIKEILKVYQKDYRVIVRTNFAFGADQIISECANEMGITIKATIPVDYEFYMNHKDDRGFTMQAVERYIELIKEDSKEYEYNFSEEDEYNMRHLLAQTVSLKVITDEQFLYLGAAQYIINKSDKLIALWDGIETKLEDESGKPMNKGGTFDCIEMAKNARKLKENIDIHIIKCSR